VRSKVSDGCSCACLWTFRFHVDGAEDCVASGAMAVSVYFCDETLCGRWVIVEWDVEFARNRVAVLTAFIA
jgi:hypothetical protein